MHFTLKSQSTINLKKDGKKYYVDCQINDNKTSFLFDTGATGILLSSAYFEQCIANGTIRQNDIVKGIKKSTVASGEVINGIDINIRRLKIGDLVLYNILARVLIDAEGSMLSGQNVLEKFGKFTFDYENLTLEIIGDKEKNIDALYEKALNKHSKVIQESDGFKVIEDTYKKARDDWKKNEKIVNDFEFEVFEIVERKVNNDINLTFKYDITNLSNQEFKPTACSVTITIEVLTEGGRTIQDYKVLNKIIPSGNTINCPDLKIKLRGRTPKSYRFYCTVHCPILNS